MIDYGILYEMYVIDKMTQQEIAEKLGYKSKTSISGMLKKHGISARKGSDTKPININVDFFKTMSPDLAYLLGLMATDGYVKSSGIIGIKLIDKDVIDWIVKTINYKNKIGTGRTSANNTYYEIWFRNKEVREILASYGIVPNKTHSLEFKGIPSEYLSHFVRGLIDGDGAIFMSNNYYHFSFACASLEFIQEFKNILENAVGGDRKIVRHPTKDIYYYRFSAKDSLKRLGDWLYSNNEFGMARKKEKFLDVMAS